MTFQTCIEMECEYIAFLWADSKCITGYAEVMPEFLFVNVNSGWSDETFS